MAKKYLLYIHDPRFQNEAEKSQLVNDLLERHYKAEGPPTGPIVTPQEISKALDRVKKIKTTLPPLIDEDECPRHHVPRSLCINQH